MVAPSVRVRQVILRRLHHQTLTWFTFGLLYPITKNKLRNSWLERVNTPRYGIERPVPDNVADGRNNK